MITHGASVPDSMIDSLGTNDSYRSITLTGGSRLTGSPRLADGLWLTGGQPIGKTLISPNVGRCAAAPGRAE